MGKKPFAAQVVKKMKEPKPGSTGPQFGTITKTGGKKPPGQDTDSDA